MGYSLSLTNLLHPNISLEIANAVACINHRLTFPCGHRNWLAGYRVTSMQVVWYTMLGSLYIGIHSDGIVVAAFLNAAVTVLTC